MSRYIDRDVSSKTEIMYLSFFNTLEQLYNTSLVDNNISDTNNDDSDVLLFDNIDESLGRYHKDTLTELIDNPNPKERIHNMISHVRDLLRNKFDRIIIKSRMKSVNDWNLKKQTAHRTILHLGHEFSDLFQSIYSSKDVTLLGYYDEYIELLLDLKSLEPEWKYIDKSIVWTPGYLNVILEGGCKYGRRTNGTINMTMNSTIEFISLLSDVWSNIIESDKSQRLDIGYDLLIRFHRKLFDLSNRTRNINSKFRGRCCYHNYLGTKHVYKFYLDDTMDISMKQCPSDIGLPTKLNEQCDVLVSISNVRPFAKVAKIIWGLIFASSINELDDVKNISAMFESHDLIVSLINAFTTFRGDEFLSFRRFVLSAYNTYRLDKIHIHSIMKHGLKTLYHVSDFTETISSILCEIQLIDETRRLIRYCSEDSNTVVINSIDLIQSAVFDRSDNYRVLDFNNNSGKIYEVNTGRANITIELCGTDIELPLDIVKTLLFISQNDETSIPDGTDIHDFYKGLMELKRIILTGCIDMKSGEHIFSQVFTVIDNFTDNIEPRLTVLKSHVNINRDTENNIEKVDEFANRPFCPLLFKSIVKCFIIKIIKPTDGKSVGFTHILENVTSRLNFWPVSVSEIDATYLLSILRMMEKSKMVTIETTIQCESLQSDSHHEYQITYVP